MVVGDALRSAVAVFFGRNAREKAIAAAILEDPWLVTCAVNAYRGEMAWKSGFARWWEQSAENWLVGVRGRFIAQGNALPLSQSEVRAVLKCIAADAENYRRVQVAACTELPRGGHPLADFKAVCCPLPLKPTSD